MNEFEGYLRLLLGIDPPIANLDEEQFLPEVIVGFTRPQGTESAGVVDALDEEFRRHEFSRVKVDLADLLEQAAVVIHKAGEGLNYEPKKGFGRAVGLMRHGDYLRKVIGSDVLARIAVLDISNRRRKIHDNAISLKKAGVAYIVRNLMHPAEVELMREIYGTRFLLIAIHQPESSRVAKLEADYSSAGSKHARDEALAVIRIDSGERPAELPDDFEHEVASLSTSLNVNDTFQLADVFVFSIESSYKPILKRVVDQLFGYPWGTPNKDELGMSLAFQAAQSSASLGRAVGAALMTQGGGTLALGWNDPAQPHGGVSLEDSLVPLREHQLTGGDVGDPSDVNRLDAVREVLDRLFSPEWDNFYDGDNWPSTDMITPAQSELRGWLAAMRGVAKGLTLTPEMVSAMPILRPLASARIFNLIEFGRAVHAEMTAITDAARRGVSIQDAVLYVTTFPCHECARNIVAAGISRVVFVEPYGKSMVDGLYRGSIRNLAKVEDIEDHRIPFSPFAGVSPRRIPSLFSSVTRKVGLRDARGLQDPSRIGSPVDWDPHSDVLRDGAKGKQILGTADFDEGYRLAEQAAVGGLSHNLKSGFVKLKERLS